MHDLAIIGGGPAGTSAAITAARAGARVLLFERGSFPRHKVCGEFVSAESLALLESLLSAQRTALLEDAIRIPQGRVFLDGRVVQTSVDPAAASIARLDLDSALWQSALESGVDVREQITVQRLAGNGPFHMNTSAGDFEARAVINASGRWSNLRVNDGGVSNSGKKWLGLKAHYAEAAPTASVDLHFFQGGYCGVQPVELAADRSKRGRVNACAMVRADVAKNLPEVFARHPALRERSQEWQPLSDPVSTSPLVFRTPKAVAENILMAGDAAGFVDPFVGDGISLALRSGALAARSLIPFFQGELSLSAAADRYRVTYDRQLAPVFSASSKIRRMLLLPRQMRAPLLYLLERLPGVTRYLVRKTR